MSGEHYFSPDPAKEKKLKPVSFEVGDLDFQMEAASGTFSQGGLDKGTKVLLTLHQDFPTKGTVLDLGCGWGPIAIAIARFSPESQIFAVDSNLRSLELTKSNALRYNLDNVKTYPPEELPQDVHFDEIWSNPPIRIGKVALHALLNKYIPRLTPGGRAVLVVQKQLGAESLKNWLAEEYPTYTVERVLNEKGYWVIEVVSPKSH